jgi:hypothetical protein
LDHASFADLEELRFESILREWRGSLHNLAGCGMDRIGVGAATQRTIDAFRQRAPSISRAFSVLL